MPGVCPGWDVEASIWLIHNLLRALQTSAHSRPHIALFVSLRALKPISLLDFITLPVFAYAVINVSQEYMTESFHFLLLFKNISSSTANQKSPVISKILCPQTPSFLLPRFRRTTVAISPIRAMGTKMASGQTVSYTFLKTAGKNGTASA